MNERDVYFMNLDVKGRKHHGFEYKNKEVLDEVLEVIHNMYAEKILNYNFGVGEVISFLKEHEVKCSGYSPWGISFAFAKKLFGLDVTDEEDFYDLVLIDDANMDDLDKLFKFANNVLVMNSNFDTSKLESCYTTKKGKYTTLIQQIEVDQEITWEEDIDEHWDSISEPES